MRGRLIFAFLAELARLDTAAMSSGAKYDSVFREPKKASVGEGPGVDQRLELPLLRLPVQVEPEELANMQATADGNAPSSAIVLIFHFRDLEAAGLVDANGVAMIRPGDRLAAIYTRDGLLVQNMDPAVYATEARPLSFGLHMARPRRNLLMVAFSDREKRAG